MLRKEKKREKSFIQSKNNWEQNVLKVLKMVRENYWAGEFGWEKLFYYFSPIRYNFFFANLILKAQTTKTML